MKKSSQRYDVLKIIIMAVVCALALSIGCAGSARYRSQSAVENEPNIPSPIIEFEEKDIIWPGMKIFVPDSSGFEVDTAAANRASRFLWAEVIYILSAKPALSPNEAFLLGTAFIHSGLYKDALPVFEVLSADSSFMLQSEAKIGRADAFSGLDSLDRAMAILDSLPKDFRERALELKYRMFLDNHSACEALDVLDIIAGEFPGHFGKMELKLARANLQLQQGDSAIAVAGYRQILRNNNGSFAMASANALDGMDELKGRDLYYAGKSAIETKSWSVADKYLGRYLDTGEKYRHGDAQYYRARAISRCGRYSEAISLYDTIISTKSYNTAWAELGKAYCHRKLRQYDSANKYTKKAIEDGAGSNAGAEALWEGVELSEDLGDYAAAGDYARKLSVRFPHHSLGDNGAMWAGLGAFAVGDFATAADRFAFIPKKYSNRKFIETGKYWRGLSLLASGDSAGYDYLTEVSRSPIRHYYKYRASAILRGQNLPDPGRATSGEWIGYGEAIEIAKAVLSESGYPEKILEIDSDNARRAKNFANMGLIEEAGYYFEAWTREMNVSPSLRLSLLETAFDWGLTGEAYRLSIKLVSDLGGFSKAPIEVIRLAYPTFYEPHVREAAEKEGIDPALLFALMRRESTFEPHVVSYAGAIGLCQFMPATGERTARELGETGDFGELTLHDWELSIRLGARHLAGLLQQYDKVEYALAVYNAGPDPLDRWRKIRHEDHIEAFIEAVDFVQTRHYIKNVLGDYYAYNELWDKSL